MYLQCSRPGLHKHSHTHTDPAIARTRYHRPPCGAAVVCDQLMVTRVQFCYSVTAVSHRPVTAEFRVRSQVSPCKICVGHTGTVTASVPVLQFSPLSTIPPMLHTHPFTYQPHYIMFLSQYFSFPLSLPFHQCSIPIHSPTTHAI